MSSTLWSVYRPNAGWRESVFPFSSGGGAKPPPSVTVLWWKWKWKAPSPRALDACSRAGPTHPITSA